MKIENVLVDLYALPSMTQSPRPGQYMSDDAIYGGRLRIVADDGTEGRSSFITQARVGRGYSENGTRMRAAQMVGRLKPELVGRDASDREWLYSRQYELGWWGGVAPQVLATIDLALWDLAGKAAGQPVYKLLGACRHTIPAYASGPYREAPEAHAELAASARRVGYRAFKIKPGGGPLARAKAIATAVREAVGDDMVLMLDGQLRFSAEEALSLGRHLQDLDFAWFEDPIPHDDFQGYRHLCRRLDLPVAYCDHHDVSLRELVNMVHYTPDLRILRSDVWREGITGLKRLCSWAALTGRKVEIHGGVAGGLHVALSVDNCDWYEATLEGIITPGTNEVIAYDESNWKRIDEEGCVHAPAEPGLGPSDDWENNPRCRYVETMG